MRLRNIGGCVTTEDLLLSHLNTKGGPPVVDEIDADLSRFLEADLTESESIAFLRDTFSRLMHDPSRSPNDRAMWEQLARAFEGGLGVLR